MPDTTYCQSRECHVSGYQVIAQADATDPLKLSLSIVDPCNTLSNGCRAKTILYKALGDFLVNEGQTYDPYTNCSRAINCAKGGPFSEFYFGSYTLVFDLVGAGLDAVTPPADPVTVTVGLPIDCETNVFA